MDGGGGEEEGEEKHPESPLPPGERVRVRGMRGEYSREVTQ